MSKIRSNLHKKKKKEQNAEFLKVRPEALEKVIREEGEKQAVVIYKRARGDITEMLFKMMMVLPTIVIMDNFGKLMKKDGRIKRFLDMVYEQYSYIESGEIDIKELCEQIQSELGEEIQFIYNDYEKSE